MNSGNDARDFWSDLVRAEHAAVPNPQTESDGCLYITPAAWHEDLSQAYQAGHFAGFTLGWAKASVHNWRRGQRLGPRWFWFLVGAGIATLVSALLPAA